MSLPHYPLGIGEIIIIRDGGVISTILGSCVSLCIYSTDGSIGGMNHFALPKSPLNVAQDEAYRYGDASCQTLLTTILQQEGVDKKKLRAKILGGASILKGEGISREIGLQNIEIAKAAIKRLGLPLTAEDTGGENGRKVFFYTDSGKVRVSQLDAEATMAATPPLAAGLLKSLSAKPPLREAAALSPRAANQLPDQGKPVAPPPKADKTRVLIVDDSKTIQEFLKNIFGADPEMEVVGVANHPGEAEELLRSLSVDVMTLDIQMPVMDGISFLEKLMPSKPMPVVMLTSMRMEDGDHVLRALELGAVDYIQKPKLQDIAQVGPQICEKVKIAARAQIQAKRRTPSAPAVTRPKSQQKTGSSGRGTPFIAMGASTGGTVALCDVLTALPAEIPPIVIVQHIPAGFSRAFAERLNSLCPFEVKEAVDGDEVCANRVLVAPGGRQMQLVQRGGRLVAEINDSDPVNRHKPSVDYLFDSVARLGAAKVLGIILTGMGADGAKGMLNLKQAGAYTIAQDEKSCVVYGMPKEAVKLGGVDKSAPLDQIAGLMERWMSEHRAVA